MTKKKINKISTEKTKLPVRLVSRSKNKKRLSVKKNNITNTAPRKMFTLNRESSDVPVVKIKVVGIGGCGNNAVSRMFYDLPRGVEFIALNTDTQDLEKTNAKYRINIGRNLTRGMGAGMNPEIGRQSAEESRAEIIEVLQGADLVFLTAGMGGGTGTGATPIVAEAAREIGALTIAVVTKPFAFEGSQRTNIAEEGILNLRDKVDSLIVIPNDKVFAVIGNDTPVNKAFLKIDDILKNTVQGISEIISTPGLINVDFADIKAIMQETGTAIVGVGQSSGGDRSIKAATQAINSPLLERSIEGARGVLFGISGGVDMKMSEINEAAKIITENADTSAKIIFGAYYDRKIPKGNLKINLIATGFNGSPNLVKPRSVFVPDLRSEDESLFSVKSNTKPNKEIEDSSKDKDDDDAMKEKIVNLFTTGEIGKDTDGKDDEEKEESVWDIPAFLRRKKKK